MKKIITTIIIILAIVLGVYWYISKTFTEHQVEVKKEREHTRITNKIKKSINELVLTYSAVKDWEKKIPTIPFTIDIQNALMSQDKPILFYGELIDIYKQNDEYFIEFDYNSSTSIKFILEITNKQIQSLLGGEHYYQSYAVIAKINIIYKPKLQLGTDISEIDDHTNTEIIFEDSDTIIAQGLCMDLLDLQDYIPKD